SVKSGFTFLTIGILLYCLMIFDQILSAPTLLNEFSITGLNLLYKAFDVVLSRYFVAAFLSPIKILVASEIVILLIASTKIGVASFTAFSAALFNALIPSSAKFPNPTERSVFSTCCNSAGNPILTRLLL